MGAPLFALDFWMQKSASFFFFLYFRPPAQHIQTPQPAAQARKSVKKTKIYIRAP
jgi:hypothetical protein